MNKVDEVINGLEVCLSGGIPQRCKECPYHDGRCSRELMKDALELLKKQKEENGCNNKIEQVTRCGDCKYSEHLPTGLLKCNGHFRSPNWYCADGAKE